MDASTYKLGIKEFISIAIIIVGIALTDNTPSIVYQQTQTAGWMQPIISAVMLIIPLILLMKVIRHFDTNDFSIMIKQILGKYIGTLSLIILCLLLTFRLILESAIYTNIIQTMFYPNTPTMILYFILMAIAGYIAYKGIINIGTVAWLLFFSIKLALLASLILTAVHGSINFLLPFFGAGEAVVIKEGVYNISIYFDLLLLCFILPHMKSKADFQRGTWVAFFVVTLELTIAFMIFLSFFDYKTIVLQNYPYMEILRFIPLFFLTNLESIFLPFWLMGSFIRFGLYLYLLLYLIKKIFHIDKINKIIPALVLFIVLIGQLPTSQQFTLFDIKILMFKVASPIIILFPITLWCVAWLKGEFKHE